MTVMSSRDQDQYIAYACLALTHFYSGVVGTHNYCTSNVSMEISIGYGKDRIHRNAGTAKIYLSIQLGIVFMDSSASTQERAQQSLAVFARLQGSLESESTLREKIRDSVREFDINVRLLTAQ